MHDLFRRFAHRASHAVGTPYAFLLAMSVIVVWAATGRALDYSETWQLIINTGTTIITFLMVFLIQNTQNRDAKAFHLKLDELIYATKGARNTMIDLDKLSDDQLSELEDHYKELCDETAAETGMESAPSRQHERPRSSQAATRRGRRAHRRHRRNR